MVHNIAHNTYLTEYYIAQFCVCGIENLFTPNLIRQKLQKIIETEDFSHIFESMPKCALCKAMS